MGNPIVKATEIMDAKISFVSLVNKAANKRQFLITKSEDGSANFQTYGSILMSEDETHYITGVVYEPMTEDAHMNYMTEAEIAKAEKYFSEHSGAIDLQHSFEPEEKLSVVESWITKCACTINGKAVKKGSWLLTVKCEDDAIWDKVTKGEITGFSMGGVGKYSDIDVDIDNVDNADEPDITDDEDVVKSAKKSLIVKLAEAFGYDCVKKGAVADDYSRRAKQNNFWAALNALEGVLKPYNSYTGSYDYETDSSVIKEALEEFSQIITEILSADNIQKAVIDTQPKKRKGTQTEKTSDDDEFTEPGGTNNSKTTTSKSNTKKESKQMTKSELTEIMKSAMAEAVQEIFPDEIPEDQPISKGDESLENMSKDEVKALIKSMAVSEVKKYANARGKATNLDAEEEEVEKSEEPEHYMHGIL